MKRIFTSIIMAGAMLCVSAQNYASEVDSLQSALTAANARLERVAEQERKANEKSIWGRGRYTKIGYSFAQTKLEGANVEDGKFGIFAQKGTNYRVGPVIADVLRFGIDAVWFDLNFNSYKSPSTAEGNWTAPIVPDPDYSYDDDENQFNIGRMAATAGMGLGPSVTVAPFARFDNKNLRCLRASLYFHYVPSAGAYIMSEDGDAEFSWAFCNMFEFGGMVTWKWISLGVEGHFGSGKFKHLEFEGESLGAGDSKFTRKFANTRLYLSFAI